MKVHCTEHASGMFFKLFAVSIMLVPLSEIISRGSPRRAMKRRRHSTRLRTDKSSAISRCIARVTTHVNKAIHRFEAPVSEETRIVPKRSIPVQSKAGEGCTRAAGRGGIDGKANGFAFHLTEFDGLTHLYCRTECVVL